MSEDIAVTKFREYLRINTEQPNPDYDKAHEFLKTYAEEFGLEINRYDVIPGRPMILLKLTGSQPELKSLVLYSHIDVVPTFPKHWKYDPYSAHKDPDGKIYARGTQDMKSVGIQYMEAYRRLRQAGKKNFKRTIYFLFGADEETGGQAAQKFVNTKEFKELNQSFTLDEGLASENDIYRVFYGERNPWWLQVKIPGSPGHGSRFIENDVGTKLKNLLDIVYAFRQEQKEKLENSNGKLTLGDVTTLNVTKISGGAQTNVVPDEFVIEIDIRIPPTIVRTFEDTIKTWISQAGEGITYTFLQHTVIDNTTPITDDDPYWKVFSNTLKDLDCKFVTEIFTGATDSRYFRELGIRSIGFSPMINTPVLLHDHNEFLEEKVFLRGVEIYEKLIENLANVPSEADI